MSKKSHRFLIIAGFALLLLAVALIVYTVARDYAAGHRAKLILEQVRELPPLPDAPVSTEIPDESGVRGEPSESSPRPELIYSVIGILNIPQLGLELPVLNECTDQLLQISVCRYLGNALPPKRLIISGHNYKSHFGNLPRLTPGDEVLFTPRNGQVYRYIVSEIEEISGYDHEGLYQGEWDITLFTCNFDRSKRILVRCQEQP